MKRGLEPVRLRASEVSPRLRARLRLFETATAVFTGRRLGEVPALANEALALARDAGSKRDEATALVILGVVAGLIGGGQGVVGVRAGRAWRLRRGRKRKGGRRQGSAFIRD